jgi:hypothetical protein
LPQSQFSLKIRDLLFGLGQLSVPPDQFLSQPLVVPAQPLDVALQLSLLRLRRFCCV